ncbi:DUF2828 family protein [Bacillus sp. FSL W8-0445]|uniref:DUF2828 family protein n=1 Tax=Bacillus sp. FSL W8-0445 TaxID=2954621 RepID=UPI0030FDBA2C
MLNHLVNEFNETETLNGALAYKSTKSAVLDLFSMGGAYRNKSDDEVVKLFSKAYAEDATLAMKALFYLRDITQGQGERRFFRLALRHLSVYNKDSLVKNLHLIPLYGRWDDMWELLETPVQKEIVKLVKEQLLADKEADNPSLLAKWMPSENASSTRTKKYARIFRKALGGTPKQYRKLLTSLREKINIVETKLTERRYEEISYDKLPSKAGMIYRDAFFRNDEKRYRAFLDSLTNGETKVNSGTLYPNDIVGKILGNHHWLRPRLSKQEIKLFEGQWNNLPNYMGDKSEDSIVMADVSRSMSGTPMNVAISLAMYIAERNKGAYKDHFMTFSERPELVKIQGTNIVEKVNNISRVNWGWSTNIEKSLQTILDVAVKNNLPNDEVVKKIYIISDMQFNHCVDGASKNIFKNMEEKFNSYGYDLPNIVFWNVNAHSNTPMTMNEVGVQLVSGFSPSILTQLLSSDGKTPYDFMLDVICGDRYQKVTA